MRKEVSCIVGAGPLMSSPIAYAQASPPAAGVQLQAGIEKENVDGDLKGAMSIYEKIASDASAPRDVRAKALLRLAGCEEKLGKQAKQVYEQIVHDFGDQPAATQARTRLAAIRQQEHPAAPETMTLRKIERGKLGSFGPGDTDGHRVTYVGADGKLYFGDIAGNSRRIIYADPEFRRAPAWVPSRDFSVVALMLPKTRTRPATLAIVKTDGSSYRELLHDNEQGNILGGNNDFHVRWSWDARGLLVYRPPFDTCDPRLWLVSVADGQRREIAHAESTKCVARAAFSPDGQFAAYEVRPRGFTQGATSRVYVVSVQGGEPRLVHESDPWLDKTAPFGALADWTSDGRYLAIKGNHEGKNALFLLPIKAGVASGPPVFVRVGDFEDAWSALSGALIFQDSSSPCYLASVGPDGKIGKWTRIELNRKPFPTMPFLSPEGTKIAYPARDLHSSGFDLIIKDLATGREGVVYKSDADFLTCGYSASRPVLFCTNEKIGGNTDLVSVSVDSGAVEQIATFPDQRYILMSPQNDTVFYFVSDGDKGFFADPKIRWDRSTQKETIVADSREAGEFVLLSLDGRWVVRQREGELSVRPASGGEWKTLASGIENSRILESTPDGNWALYLASDPQGHQGIFEAPFSGGEPRRVGDLPDDYPSPYGLLTFSPDGRTALGADMGIPGHSLWSLENFEPKTSK